MTAFVQEMPEVGDLLELSVGEVAHGGWCVARTGPGPVVFVRHALPGERVRAVVTQTTSRFARADATVILDPSADRATPPCPHARPGGCGGCDWQHASLPAQRALKAAVVRQQLRRMAGIDREITVEPVPGDQEGLGWRTRVTFAVRPDGVAGLRRHRSHEVMGIGECPIAHPLVTAAGVTGRAWPGAASVEVAAAPGSGQRAVIVTGPPPGGQIAAGTVLARRARASRLAVLRGSGYLHRRAAGRDWRVGAAGFWQVHPGAADVLAAAVLGALRPRAGDVALDLYCGAGLFAGVLAEAVGPAGAVIGIERDPAAVRDARHNLRSTPWARVHRGDVAAVLGRAGLAGASLAVLDPPRAGVARSVLDLLSALPAPCASPAPCAPPALCASPTLCAPPAPRASPAPLDHPAPPNPPNPSAPPAVSSAGAAGLRRIAYVSCDPATLARDIAVLRGSGWRLEGLRAFDAFPMTHHVECVATLTRGGPREQASPAA